MLLGRAVRVLFAVLSFHFRQQSGPKGLVLRQAFRIFQRCRVDAGERRAVDDLWNEARSAIQLIQAQRIASRIV